MLCEAQGIETVFDNIFLWILFYKNVELMCYPPETNIILQVTYTSGKNCLILKFPSITVFDLWEDLIEIIENMRRNELGGDEGEWKGAQ